MCAPKLPASQGTEQKEDDAFRLVQVLVRTDVDPAGDGAQKQSLSKVFAPYLMVQALANKRLDIVREVYDNCHYLPRLAQEDRS